MKPHSEYGIRTGPDQLERYVQMLKKQLRAKKDKRQVLKGFELGREEGVPVPGTGGYIDIWSGRDTQKGIRFYGENKRRRESERAQSPISRSYEEEPSVVERIYGGVKVVGGVVLAVGTIAEDIGTAGAGIADDAPTLAGAGAMIANGWSAMFG